MILSCKATVINKFHVITSKPIKLNKNTKLSRNARNLDLGFDCKRVISGSHCRNFLAVKFFWKIDRYQQRHGQKFCVIFLTHNEAHFSLVLVAEAGVSGRRTRLLGCCSQARSLPNGKKICLD